MNAVSQIALRSGYRQLCPSCAGRLLTRSPSADEQAAVLVVAKVEEREAREDGKKRNGKKER